MKTRDEVCSRILTNFAEVFQQVMEARTTCLIYFIKLLFSVLANRKTIYKVPTVNSHNSETVEPHAHVIFVLHSAIKAHLLTNENSHTIQIIL